MANLKKVKEAVVVVEEKKEVRSYVVPILFQREPIEKDVPVADLFYRVASNLIEMQCHRPNYEAQLDMIIEGDISMSTEIGGTVLISKSNSPVDWIKNLHKSNEFSGKPFVAEEALELYEA